jgi:hypothetical protein
VHEPSLVPVESLTGFGPSIHSRRLSILSTFLVPTHVRSTSQDLIKVKYISLQTVLLAGFSSGCSKRKRVNAKKIANKPAYSILSTSNQLTAISWPRGATVARSTPDRKVIRSNRVGVIIIDFDPYLINV